MTFSIDVTHPGGCPWPIYPASAEVGHEVTAVDAVSQGLVVQACRTEADFDESQISGPDSMFLNMELPTTAPTDAEFASFLAVVTNQDAVAAGGKARVVYGPCTVQATCIDGTETEWKVGTPLTVNTSGQLVKAGVTGEVSKLVAVVAKETPVDSVGSAQLVWVHFSGIFPFGNFNRVT